MNAPLWMELEWQELEIGEYNDNEGLGIKVHQVQALKNERPRLSPQFHRVCLSHGLTTSNTH